MVDIGQCQALGTPVSILNPDFNISEGSSLQPGFPPQGWTVIQGSTPKFIFGSGLGFSFGSPSAYDAVTQNVTSIRECKYQITFTLVIAESAVPSNAFNVTIDGRSPYDSSGSTLSFSNMATGVFPILGNFIATQNFSNLTFSGRSRTGSISLHEVGLKAL